jgi:hypothetical protein
MLIQQQVTPINLQARLLCRQLSAMTDTCTAQIKEYLRSAGKAEKLMLVYTENPFSIYTPKIAYLTIKGIRPTLDTIMCGRSIDDLIDASQFQSIREIGQACAEEIEDTIKQNKDLFIRQEEQYERLLAMTVVESRFPQPEKKERVILYAVADQPADILRADKFLLDDEPPAYTETNKIPRATLSSALKEIMMTEAEQNDANVYCVTCSGPPIPSQVVAEHVLKTLKMTYLKEHPCAIEDPELAQKQTVWMKSDSPRQHDAATAAEPFIFTNENGTRVGIVPPGKPVTDEMIEKLVKEVNYAGINSRKNRPVN